MNRNYVLAFTFVAFLAASQPAWAQLEGNSEATAQSESIGQENSSSEHRDDTSGNAVASDFGIEDQDSVEVEATPEVEVEVQADPEVQDGAEPEVDGGNKPEVADEPAITAEIAPQDEVSVKSESRPEAAPAPQLELDISRSAPDAPVEELSERDVLKAVEQGQAVLLSAILPDVRSRTGGEIINAHFREIGGILVYGVTVLTPKGKVSTEYYEARSGQHVDR